MNVNNTAMAKFKGTTKYQLKTFAPQIMSSQNQLNKDRIGTNHNKPSIDNNFTLNIHWNAYRREFELFRTKSATCFVSSFSTG